MKHSAVAVGIHCYHDAAVSICTPDGLLFSVQEERLTRIKHHYGFPAEALRLALKYTGLSARDVGYLCFSTQNVLFPQHTNYVSVRADGQVWSRAWHIARGLARRGALRGAGGSAPADWGEFAGRHYANFVGVLAESGFFDPAIRHVYVNHHLAHASSAFRLSGLETACVVTGDGKGDGLAATVYRGERDGRLRLLRSTPAQHSLGSFYQAVTEALGFVPVDSEYKTMGLAALGEPEHAGDPFGGIVRVQDGAFCSSVSWRTRDFNAAYPDRKLPNPLTSIVQSDDFRPHLDRLGQTQFAYFAQRHFETNMLALTADALRISGCRDLVAAGGILLNVKANAAIRDQLVAGEFFVFPDAGDSGLAAGAALQALHAAGHMSRPVRLGSPYLGHNFTPAEIEAALDQGRRDHGLRVSATNPAEVAARIAQGRVIGNFQGRLEMGPRALGNRSVLADPRDAAVKERINGLLKGREWYVPFAPSVLAEDAARLWSGPADYPYMTFAVTASDYAKRAVPAVVHVDGTMRPQVVTRERNPAYFELISEFKKLTGIGVLVNTSFNRHGLPIVGSPTDAVWHLVNGYVDALAVGPWWVERT